MITANASISTPAVFAPLPKVYYEPASGRYFLKNAHGEWMGVSYATAESYVVSLGYERAKSKTESQAEAEKVMLRIQLERSVHYAGPLAGYKAGPHLIGATRALITRSVLPVSPGPGDWPTLRHYLEGLLGSKQLVYLYGWIKQTLTMLRSAKHRPGHALALCGPAGAGKTFLGAVLTRLFGGDPGHPWKFMNDKTQFNSDLFGSVLLIIDDAAESVDIRARRHFAAHIKQIVAVQDQSCHKKHVEQLSLRPLWRLMILLNDDPERLMVLPPLDADIVGKMMLFKTEAYAMPLPTGAPEESDALMETMVAELPAFVSFIDGWSVPLEMSDPRFGIECYHHPDIVRDLDATTPEIRLREMIDEVIFGSVKAMMRPEPWEGKAVELERLLTDRKSPCAREADRLLPAGGAVCGKYLGRLAKQEATRFSQRKEAGLTVWTVQPPDGAGKPSGVSECRAGLEAHIRAKAEEKRSLADALPDHASFGPDEAGSPEPTEQSETVPAPPCELPLTS